MIKGMVKHELLKTSDGVLRLAEDTLCGGFSLGIRTPEGADWRYISDSESSLISNCPSSSLIYLQSAPSGVLIPREKPPHSVSSANLKTPSLVLST